MLWQEKLRALKASTNMSTREIAEQSGIPEPTLEKLFSGQTKNPGISTVQQLVHTLGYTLDDIDTHPPKPASDLSLTPEEQTLVTDYRRLAPPGKEYVQQSLALALRSYSEKNNAVSELETAL